MKSARHSPIVKEGGERQQLREGWTILHSLAGGQAAPFLAGFLCRDADSKEGN
jgi:hypothetical protein